MKLLPSRRKFCVHHTTMHQIYHFMQSDIRKVHACVAVTCHLHFWQNDRGLLRATAVTRGWNGYRNNSQHRKLTLEKKKKKISRRSCRNSNPRPFNHESGALTTELPPFPELFRLTFRGLAPAPLDLTLVRHAATPQAHSTLQPCRQRSTGKTSDRW